MATRREITSLKVLTAHLLLAATTALLERQLPLLEAGKPLELTSEDRAALEAVLAVLPMDPVAAYSGN